MQHGCTALGGRAAQPAEARRPRTARPPGIGHRREGCEGAPRGAQPESVKRSEARMALKLACRSAPLAAAEVVVAVG